MGKFSEDTVVKVCYAVAGVTICIIAAMVCVVSKVIDDITA